MPLIPGVEVIFCPLSGSIFKDASVNLRATSGCQPAMNDRVLFVKVSCSRLNQAPIPIRHWQNIFSARDNAPEAMSSTRDVDVVREWLQ
jgi:hypothetical protein